MTGLVIVTLSLGVFAVLPWIIANGLGNRTSPKVLASMYLLALIGLAFLPIGWLACLASGIGYGLSQQSALSITCSVTGGGFNVWRIFVEFLSSLLFVRLIWVGIRAARANSQLNMQLRESSSVSRVFVPSDARVVILPSEVPVAFAVGILRPRVIITTGLLELLEPTERRAVVEHELAHLRLGHTRVLFFTSIIAFSYSWLPPVQWAMGGLRREFEASADDQAAAVCGSKPLLLALAKVGIYASNWAVASFADSDTLRYRIKRLEAGSTSRSKIVPAGLFPVVSLVIVLSLSLCGLFGSVQLPSAELGCVLGIGSVALYVLCPWESISIKKFDLMKK